MTSETTIWLVSARLLAGLVATVSLVVGSVSLYLHLIFGVPGDRSLGFWLGEAALGAAYYFGLTVIGVLYAYRPFRFGFAALLAYAIVPWIIAYVLWRMGITGR